MAYQEVTMYRLVCDEDGCDASAQDGGEYVAWAEHEGCDSEAEGADWHHTDDGRWLCPDHQLACIECGMRLEDDGTCPDCQDESQGAAP